MTALGNMERTGHSSRWRIARWSLALSLLLLPLVAMQFTREVVWTSSDFAVAAFLIGSVGIALELALRLTANVMYRAAASVALATAFLLVWSNLAIGIIGDEGNPANLFYGGVLAVGVIGAVIVRLEPEGMARVMLATTLAQALVAAAVPLAGIDPTGQASLREVGMVTAFFAGLWLFSAWLFHKAAQSEALAPSGRAS